MTLRPTRGLAVEPPEGSQNTESSAGIDRVPPQALIVAGMLTTQLGAGLARHLFEHNAPASIGMLRLGFAALVLLAVGRPRLTSLSKRDVAVVCGFGVSLAVMNLSFYEALDRLPLGVTVTIEFLGPLSVAVAGSRRRLDVVWAIVACVGVLAFFRGGGPISAVGVAFSLLAGACWGIYILLNAAAGKRFSGSSGLAVAMTVGALISVPFGVADATTHLLSFPVLAAGFVVGIASSALPYSFETAALRRLSTRVFGVLMSLEPAIAALVGLVVLRQALGWREWLGIALVVAASVGVTRRGTAVPPHD